MKMVKRLFIIFIMVFLQSTMSAQTNNVTSSTSVVNKNVVVDSQSEQTLTNTSLVSPSDAAEPIPTPEQQGFTKVLSEGKTVYYKEVDGVVIEFKPEQF